MMVGDSGEDVVGQVTAVGTLFNEVERWGVVEGLMKFGDLEADQLAEEGARGDGCKKISLASGSGFAGGVVANFGLIEGNFHKTIKSQRSMMMNLLQERRRDWVRHLMRLE